MTTSEPLTYATPATPDKRRHRWRRVAITCIVVLVGLAMLWLRSYWRLDVVRAGGYALGTEGGTAAVVVFKVSQYAPISQHVSHPWSKFLHPYGPGWDHFLGIGWGTSPAVAGSGVLYFPIWLAMLPPLALLVLAWRRMRGFGTRASLSMAAGTGP